MTLQFEPLERAKTYELVVRAIKDEIFAGRLRPGDRLPGERQLSEQLKVSRPSVREAIRILQAMQIVRTSPGTGEGSGLIISARPSQALTDLLGVHVALSSYDVKGVMSVRAALEIQAVRQLASNPDGRDLSAVRDALERMSSADLERTQFHDVDTEFHVEMAQATGNVLLADLMGALRNSVRRPMDEIFADVPDWGQRQEELLAEHRAIFEAVEANDVERAADLVKTHIEAFYLFET